MPETVYVPLDGSGPRGCWGSLTSLEKILILLSVTLGIFVLALTLAIVNCKSNHGGGNSTTIAPDTTVPTTHIPGPPTTSPVPTTDKPVPTTEVPTTTIKPKPTTEPTTKISTTETTEASSIKPNAATTKTG